MKVNVKGDALEVKDNLVIHGYSVTGRVINAGQPVKGVIFLIQSVGKKVATKIFNIIVPFLVISAFLSMLDRSIIVIYHSLRTVKLNVQMSVTELRNISDTVMEVCNVLYM